MENAKGIKLKPAMSSGGVNEKKQLLAIKRKCVLSWQFGPRNFFSVFIVSQSDDLRGTDCHAEESLQHRRKIFHYDRKRNIDLFLFLSRLL